jgi:hypothetical protein
MLLADAVHAQESAADEPDTPILDGTTLGLFADGTWDCNDSSGNYLGAIVVADLSYAFVNPDATVGTYGKLNKDDWTDAPAFFILTGELKDRFAAVGLSVKGPQGNPEDYTDRNKLLLQVVITAETKFFCSRRRGPVT